MTVPGSPTHLIQMVGKLMALRVIAAPRIALVSPDVGFTVGIRVGSGLGSGSGDDESSVAVVQVIAEGTFGRVGEAVTVGFVAVLAIWPRHAATLRTVILMS